MKRILCYGDSNTWGAIPGETQRLEYQATWPGVLQALLGAEVQIIAEGLRGRTTIVDDPLKPGRNGLKALPMILETHEPIDLVIVFLGTNDLKARYGLSPFCIAQGAGKLIELCRLYRPIIPAQLLISPAHAVETDNYEKASAYCGAVEKSKLLAVEYEKIAALLGCGYFDAAEKAVSSRIDGVHIDAASHQNLGNALAVEITNLLRRGADCG